MKRLFLLLIISIFISCSQSTTPPAPSDNSKPEPSSPYNGYFAINAVVDSFDCASPPDPGEVPQHATVTISGDSITIDYIGGKPAKGLWDGASKHGTAVSEETCIPVDLECSGCFAGHYDITFSDSTSFSGTYTIVFRYVGKCPNANCSDYFSITGSKQ